MTVSNNARDAALKSSNEKTMAWSALCGARLNKAPVAELAELQKAYDAAVEAERKSLHMLQAAIMLSSPPVRRVSTIGADGMVDVQDFREDPHPARAQAKFDFAVAAGALAVTLVERDRSSAEERWIVLARFPEAQ